MQWLKRLLMAAIGENRFVTIEQLYEAAVAEQLSLLEAPEGGWPGREEHVRLASNTISLFYMATNRKDGKRVESLDLHTLAHKGGLWVTFVDNQIVALTQNTIKRNVTTLRPETEQRLWQILLKVRQAASA